MRVEIIGDPVIGKTFGAGRHDIVTNGVEADGGGLGVVHVEGEIDLVLAEEIEEFFHARSPDDHRVGAVAGSDFSKVGADVDFFSEFIRIRGREVGPFRKGIAGDIDPVVVFRVAVGEEDIPIGVELIEFFDQIGENTRVLEHFDVVLHDPDCFVTRIVGVFENRELAERDADHAGRGAVAEVGTAHFADRLVVPDVGEIARAGGVGARFDVGEVLFSRFFQAVAGGEKAVVHTRSVFHSYIVDRIEGELPSVDGRKAVGMDSVEDELLEGVLELLGPLIEIDHVDEIDARHRVNLCFIGSGFEVVLKTGKYHATQKEK